MNSLAHPDLPPLYIRPGRAGRLLLGGNTVAAAFTPERCRELIDRCFSVVTLASLRLERDRSLRLRFAPDGRQMPWPATVGALAAAMRAPTPVPLPLANADLLLESPGSRPATIRRAGNGRLTFWNIERPAPNRLRCVHPWLAHPRVREAVLEELTTLAGVEEMEVAPWRRTSFMLRCERPEGLSPADLLDVLEPAIARAASLRRASRARGGKLRSALVNTQLALSPINDYLLTELRPITTGLFLILNWSTARRALQALRRRSYNLSVLRAAMGVLTLYQGRYTSDSVMTKLLENWPRWSQRRRQAAERRFLARFRAYPRRVWVERDNVQTEISLSELRSGEPVTLRPGDTVPGDGVVLEGEGGVQEGWLTGQTGVTPKRAGDRLFASGRLCEGELRMRLETYGEGSVAARLAARYRQLFDRPCPKVRAGRLAERSAWLSFAGAVAGGFRGGLETVQATARPDYVTGPGIAEEFRELAGIFRAGLCGFRVTALDTLTRLAEADVFVIDGDAGPWGFDRQAAQAGRTIGARLHRLGVRELVLLSGRPILEVTALAGQLGADVALGDQQAADKAAFLADRLRARRKPVYLSHGSPDPLTGAPAFVALPLRAAVSAERTGGPLEEAAVSFSQPDLEGVVELRRLARAAVRGMRWGQGTTLAVNAACVAGALALEWPVLAVVALTNAGTLLNFLQGSRALLRACTETSQPIESGWTTFSGRVGSSIAEITTGCQAAPAEHRNQLSNAAVTFRDSRASIRKSRRRTAPKEKAIKGSSVLLKRSR